MKVADPGHSYILNFLDGSARILGQDTLTFVKREGEKYPGNVGHYPGTTMQEVLRAVIDRLKYVNNQQYDSRNVRSINKLRSTIWMLELRAAEKHGRSLKEFHEVIEIENIPYCKKCGHIGCEGECH